MSDKLIEQWGALSPDSRFTDSAELALRAGVFERQIRRRNLIEFLAGAIVIVLFARSAWTASNAGHAFLALGWLAGIIGTVIILANLYYRASTVQRRPEDDCRTHLRAQLEHQRVALTSVPRWYIGPLIPGMSLIVAASTQSLAQQFGWGGALIRIAPSAALIAAIFVGVAWLNRRAARKLKAQIAELDEIA
jgi:hypothetical protein